MSEEFRQVSISELRTSGLNDLIYSKISVSAADIVELAESIRINGLLEPLVISTDGVIVSGHRRFAACIAAGIDQVKCRVLPIHSDEQGFLKVLREYNRQRVKGIDEVVRERIIDENGKQAVEAILSDRINRSNVNVPMLEVNGEKVRAQISINKYPFLNAIIQILNQRRNFWPLSDRQIHYALLNDPPLIHAKKPHSIYGNDRKSYQSLCDLLTRARLEGYIPWAAIADPTRPVIQWTVYPNIEPFIKNHFDTFLTGYYRNLIQSQSNHIEIVGEKNTIESTIRPIAMKYCVPYTIGRGYCSIQPRYELAQRFRQSGKVNLVILILTDYDPDGDEIAQSFVRSLRDEFGVRNLHPVKVALTKDQVEELRLPIGREANRKSRNYQKWSEGNGGYVFELEAVEPVTLQELLSEAILSVIDKERFNTEVEQEKKDIAAVIELKEKLMKAITAVYQAGGQDGI